MPEASAFERVTPATRPPWWEGVTRQHIIQPNQTLGDIYQSAREGQPVKLPITTKLDPFRGRSRR